MIEDGEYESADAERARHRKAEQYVTQSLNSVSLLVMSQGEDEAMLIFPAFAQREALRLQKMMLQKYGKLSESAWELTSVHGIWMLNCPRHAEGQTQLFLPELQTLVDKAVLRRLPLVTVDPHSDAFADAMSRHLDQPNFGGGMSLN